MPKWPRGKHNGQRIVGFAVKLIVEVDYVCWLPRASWNFGNPYLIWLIFNLRAEARYAIEQTPF